ncbi:MAG: trypsin-like peptidase domain-containing protein [Candidatus Saccharimonadales bacterium]
MEDLSQNPYIPQESEQIRQKVYERHSPLGRVVKWALIITVVVAVLVGVGLFFVVPKTTAVDQQARVKLADALQPPDQTLKRVAVASELGFELNYDNRVYSSYAEVGDSSAGTDSSAAVLSGETYENNDLRIARAYNYVRIRPLQSVDSQRALAPLPPQLELFATVSDDDLTKAAAVPENRSFSKLSLFVKIDGDKRTAKKVADDKTVVTIDATKPVSSTVGGIDYQKVRYTTTNDNYRISNVKYDDCYYTIQNNRPYSICLTGIRPSNVSAASLVEDVFNMITFQEPNVSESTSDDASTPKKTSFVPLDFRLAQATTTDTNTDTSTDSTDNSTTDAGESPLLTVKPLYYDDANSLQTIAKSQPSVVRIGTLYCTNLALKLESGDTAITLSDACSGNTSSGVFISKDGLIATTGHAIRTQKKAAIAGYINFAPDQDQMLDRLQRVLDYLLKSRIILQSDADYLKTGASIGDQEALAKIQNLGSVIPDNFITPIDETYTYAIQPTDKPIVVNRTDTARPSFAYSDTVLSAKYVASNYEVNKSVQEVFNSDTPTQDVGILKLDGDYPSIPIVPKEDVRTKDTLNILGFPAYSDSTLSIDKIRNQPIATVVKVEQAYQKDGQRLIQIDAPVSPGNDGAPVFDNEGQLIGFAVYGFPYCPDQQCFANGTVRSSAELLKLLDDENMSLSTDSQIATNWREGVTQYFRANYAASVSAFTLSGSAYPFNRWAEPLSKLSTTYEGSTSDTSLMNQLQLIMIIVLVILVIVTILLIIAFVLQRQRLSQMRVGHYGTEVNNAVPAPASPPPMTVLPPVNSFPSMQPSQPVQQQYSKPIETPVLSIQKPSVFPQQPNPNAGQQPPNYQVDQNQQVNQQPQNTQSPEDPFYK